MIADYLSDPKRCMFLSDFLIAFCIILLFSVFKGFADLVLVFAWFFILGYMMLTRRTIAVAHLILATFFAVIWVHYAKDYYGYKFDYHRLFGMNLLPLMAWTLALFGLGEVYNYLGLTKKRYKFLLFIPVFWFLLILFETVAYHILEIRNTTTGSFVGLPYCNCIHAPTWMKVVYFSMGPSYYASTLMVDNLIKKKFPRLAFYDSNN